MNRRKLITRYGLILFAVIIAALAFWPYQFVVSPHFTLRIVDSKGQPLSGIRVVCELHNSQEQLPNSEKTTDIKGEANFGRVAVPMNRLKRILKPLLIVIPGAQWEVYSSPEFEVYLPLNYVLRFDQNWKKDGCIFENSDGVCVYDPKLTKNNDYVGFYFMNKRQDLIYTLVAYK